VLRPRSSLKVSGHLLPTSVFNAMTHDRSILGVSLGRGDIPVPRMYDPSGGGDEKRLKRSSPAGGGRSEADQPW